MRKFRYYADMFGDTCPGFTVREVTDTGEVPFCSGIFKQLVPPHLLRSVAESMLRSVVSEGLLFEDAEEHKETLVWKIVQECPDHWHVVVGTRSEDLAGYVLEMGDFADVPVARVLTTFDEKLRTVTRLLLGLLHVGGHEVAESAEEIFESLREQAHPKLLERFGTTDISKLN